MRNAKVGQLTTSFSRKLRLTIPIQELFWSDKPYSPLNSYGIILALARQELPLQPSPSFDALWEICSGCWKFVEHSRPTMRDIVKQLQNLPRTAVPTQLGCQLSINLVEGWEQALDSLVSQGEMEEARQISILIRDMVTRSFGEDHPNTFDAMTKLAELEHLSEDVIRLEIIKRQRRVFEEDHPDIWSAMDKLADCYSQDMEFAKEEEIRQETLELHRRFFGENRRETWSAMDKLADYYFRHGEIAKEGAIRQEILEWRRRSFGEDHPDTWSAMHKLADCYSRDREVAKEGAIRLEILKRRRRSFGEDHPDTWSAMNKLA